MMTNDSTSPLQSLKSEVFRTPSKIYIRGFIAAKKCCSGKFFQNSCLTEHLRVTTSVITNYLLVIKLLLYLENVKTYVFSVFGIFITLIIFK